MTDGKSAPEDMIDLTNSSDDEVVARRPPPKTNQAKAQASSGKETLQSSTKRTHQDSNTSSSNATNKKPRTSASTAPPPPSENDTITTPTAKQKTVPKWVQKQSAGPSNPGSKIIPEGAENCLEGLTFVFTGELESLAREEAQDLAKRYSGRVTGQPSGKTSYVVMGEGAGPKKLQVIAKLGIKTLTEDEFLNLISTRKAGKLSEVDIKKKEKEAQKIKDDAKEMAVANNKDSNSSSQLWTVKYAPKQLKDVCGNKALVERLMQWLEDWPKSVASNFKRPGPNGLNVYRAVLISGPPGIGKTTAAHIAAKLKGYNAVEMNASDTRSKKLLETGFRSTIDQTSLDKWYNSNDATSNELGNSSDRLVLIMDEVDGMSAGDRGGVGALNVLIKKTKIPIIAIANDRSLPKMKPLQLTTYNMTFRKPNAAEIRSRMLTVAHNEKLKLPVNVVDQLINGVQSDIRQVLNMMSTWKLSSNTMTFDESQKLTQFSEKLTLQTPFTLLDRLFGPYSWSSTNKSTINNKLEVFFQDFSAMPLFTQENYAKHKFARVGTETGPEAQMKKLDLLSKAATSISDGDLMDRLLHEGNHWSLLPAFGVASTIKPSYYTYGTGSHGWSSDGVNSRAFPAWFGKNSTSTRLKRALRDIQIRMRLRVSGDQREIRQSYLAALFPRLLDPLLSGDDDAIDSVIETMDQYYLTKDEWDSIMELLLCDERTGRLPEEIIRSIPTKVKTAFTRKYNATSHPIPFHTGDLSVKNTKKLSDDAAPDFEDVVEAEDDIVVEGEGEGDEGGSDDGGISKDKLVKEKKPNAKAKGTATGKSKAFTTTTQKGKGKTSAKGK